ADSKVGQFSINHSVGYSVPDSKRNLNDGATYGLDLEYRYTPNWAAQVFYNESGTEVKGLQGVSDNHYDYKKYGLNGLYYFNPEARLQPYLLMGIGNGEYEGDNDTQLNLGGGVRYFLTHA